MKRPGPLRRAAPYIVLYIVLAAVPVLMWRTAGNPVAATAAYFSLDRAELLWNTLLSDPRGDDGAFLQAALDLLWIVWTPFALAAALQLLVTVFRIPHAVIPRILLRLTPTTVVSVVVTGTATIAQAHTGAIHATAAHHHDHDRTGEHGHHGGPGRRHSILESQILQSISHPEHHRRHEPAHLRTVEQGDSLWLIAKDAYGDGQDWPEIYNANRGHVEHNGEALTDPDLIKPGWTLTVPHTRGAMPPPRATAPTPALPNVIAPTVPTGPAANAATSAAPGRVTSETPDPATANPRAVPSAADHPVPPATKTAGHRATHHAPHADPGPRTDAPWTTGLELPDGGYIGITLLMAITGATAALRRRARRTGQSPDVPESATHLAIVATRAEMVATGDWDPELETDPTPPPLIRPRPEYLIFGTAPTGTDEAILDPQRHPLTVYTGPGASQAAAALALSALASQPPHRLIITEALGHQLLGADADPQDADWLALPPDAAAALTAAADNLENPDDARTLIIADAQSANTFQISAALAADRQRNRLAILLIGDPSHLAAHTPTTIDIDTEGRPRKTAGPRAAAFAGTRFHTVPPATAADLYRILRHDRASSPAAMRIPGQTRDGHGHHVGPVGERPERDPTDAEDHRDPADATLDATQPPPQEVMQPLPATTTPTSDGISPPAGQNATPAAPLLLRVLGPLTFENAAGQTRPGPRGRNAQLLTYLAIHPRGRTLQQITAAIWHTDKPGGPNRTLVRVRQELHAALSDLASEHVPEAGEDIETVIREPHGAYHLNHQLIRTDYSDFTRLEAEARAENDPAHRAESAAQALARVRGELAEGVSDLDQRWLVAERADLDDRTTSLTAMSPTADLADEVMPQTPYVPVAAKKTASL